MSNPTREVGIGPRAVGEILRRLSGTAVTGHACWSLFGAALLSACGASSGIKVAQPDGGSGSDGRMPHEACDLEGGGAKGTDANGDGRPDVMTATWAHGVCKAIDLNFDGKVDVWLYQDGSGSVVRREFDFDVDGQIDEVQLYEGGQLVRRYRSGSRPGRIDTWDWLQGGRLVRSERDADGNGVVDQWWDFANPTCPVITSDHDGDGKPDPATATDTCKGDAFSNLNRTEGPRGPSFERPGGAPEEVENRAAGGEAKPAAGEKGAGK